MADVETNAQETKKEDVNVTENTDSKNEPTVQTEDNANGQKGNEPSVQDLLVQIAKLKRDKDKASSEAADYRKKWKDSMTEQEKASMEKAEAQAKRDEEFESMKRTIQIQNLTENYMDLGYSKELAKKAATAQAENDVQTLLDVQKQFQEAQKKEWEAEFLKNRPDVNIGGTSGKTYTKEQFDKMNPIELTKLKRENEAEYNRLLAL